MSSKDVASLVPVFVGQDFRSWKEKMLDYLGSQRLLGYPSGQHQRPVAANVAQPTQLELTAQADWDETDLQVKSLIALRLSSNLRTHIGMTSEETWTSLDTMFGTPHFTGIFKDYELAHSIRLTMGENPEIQIQRLWTILECLQMNGCVISNYLQGMLLLKAIPREWDTVAQMYCNGMQMTNITFSGVRDAIMAKFERTARPGQLAHQADKKCKGPSPCFNEQRIKTQLPVQPLMLLKVSQARRGQGRVVNVRRLAKPVQPTVL